MPESGAGRMSEWSPRAGRVDSEYLTQVLNGLRHYFDEALGAMLLYRFERQQYAQQRQKNPDFRASDVYGAEHLVRLTSKWPSHACPHDACDAIACRAAQLPLLISQTDMGPESVEIVKKHVDDILRCAVPPSVSHIPSPA